MHQRSRFHHDHVGKLPQRALPIREKALGPEHPKQDLSAVESAVSKPWSNGPVEGHINRLKMLKRQMYGRAGIELLRARLLPEPALMDP